MSKPWMRSVKERGELTVYNGLNPGNWVHIFKTALQASNQLGPPMKMSAAISEEKLTSVRPQGLSLAISD